MKIKIESVCDFCEHDHGPYKVVENDPCTTCEKHCNFFKRNKMIPEMQRAWDLMLRMHMYKGERDVALSVLKDLSAKMRVDHNLFGRKELCIGVHEFEEIRKKYLDKHKEVNHE